MRYRNQMISRRTFAGAALATTGLAATGGLAHAAPALTAGAPMGPFYPIERPADDDFDMTMVKGGSGRALGRVIEVSGRVLDRKGNPVSGAVLELWQCNAAGRYAHAADVATAPLDPNFQGFAKLTTGSSGEWRVRTIKPSGYDSPIGHRTPHIHFDIFGRQHRLISQMYFSEDHDLNAKDMLYKQLGDDAITAIAKQDAADTYRWDIVLMEG